MKATRTPAITPLIDDATACAVIERRSKNQWTGRKSSAWVALLTPIAYWHGQKLRAQARDYGNFYRTRGREGVSFDGDKIDTELANRLARINFTPEVRADYRQAIEARIGVSRRAEMQRQEARLLGEMDMLIDLLRDKMIDRQVYNSRYTIVEAQIREVRQQANAPDDVDRLMDTLNGLAVAITTLPPVKRRMAMQHIFERVDIGDDGQIERLYAREWAKAAFTALANVPIMPLVRYRHKSGIWVTPICG